MLFKNQVVLVVDDSYTIRHQVKLLLKKYDITVLEAWDKKSMMGYLSVNNRPIDLIIMDLGLRNESGFTLMEYVRSTPNHSKTPIIILTGNAKRDAVLASIPYAISYYVVKPINPYDLSLKVLTALECKGKTDKKPYSSYRSPAAEEPFQDYNSDYFEEDSLTDIENELDKTNMSKINKVLDVDITPIKKIGKRNLN